MPNGENGSQTGIEDISGDLKNILKSARVDLIGNVSDNPDEVTRDVAYIKQLQQMFPDFQGKNAYNVKHSLIHNEDGALDKVATRFLTIKAQNEPDLQERIQDPEEYKKEYNRIKSVVKRNSLAGSVTGESIGQTIVDRKLDIFKRGYKPDNASASYRNNNPLNIMATSVSDSLAGNLSNKGIKFSASDITNEDGTLAKFSSYEDGFEAAKTAIKEGHADSTVNAMMSKWSNGGYDASILEDEELGSKKVSELAPTQLEKIMKRMQKQEGWTEGEAAKRSVPIVSYKKYIQNNPEKYQEFGIVDGEGNLIFDGLNDENRSLEASVESSDELHKQLLQDRYKEFEDVLDNQNNMPNELQGHPSFKAQAFAVYDKFGSEGLTNFINIVQHDELKESSPNVLRKSLEWYNNNDVGRVRQRFIGQGKDRISFTPPKATLDLVAKVPADANNFASIKYKFNKEERKFVEKDKETLINDFINRYTDVPFEDIAQIASSGIGPASTGPSRSLSAFFNYVANLDYFTEGEEEYKEGFKKELGEMEKSGLFMDNGYSVMLTNVMSKHRKEGDVGSLVQTLQANGEFAGEGKWIVDYENADFATKVAIDALNQSTDYGSLVYPMQDSEDKTAESGKVVLDLKRRERVAEKVNELALGAADRVGATDWKLDKEKNRWVKEFDDGFFDDIFNTLETVNFGALQMLDRHFIGPTLRRMASTFRTVENLTGSETAEDISRFLDYQAESDLVEGVNSVQIADTFSTELGSDLAFVNNGGFLPQAVAKATPMAQVIGSIYLKGRGTLGGIQWGAAKSARFINQTTKTGKAMSALGASKYLKGNKFQVVMDRWAEAQKAKKFWTYGGTFYLGDAVEEMSMPKNMTMMNFGTRLVDDHISKYFGMETDYNQDYRAANGIVRIGLDFLASFGISSLFDNLLVAPVRYGKDWGAAKLGKKVPTLDINPKTGQAIKKEVPTKTKDRIFGSGTKEVPRLDKIQWRNDMTEFYHNITKDLDSWAISKASSSIRADMLAGVKHPQEDLTTHVRNSIKDMGKFVDDDLKGTIEETVRYYTKRMGNKVSDEDIAKITEERYDEFLEKMADGIFNLFNKANKEVPEQLPLKIANILENGSITIKTMSDEAGGQLMRLENAQKAAKNDVGKIIKQVKDRYIVKDVQENSWAVQLGTKIRKKAKDQGIDAVIREERAIEKGYDGSTLKEFTEQEEENMRSIWSYLYGRKVNTDQGPMYLTGLSKYKAFKGVNDAGEEITGVQIEGLENVPEDVANYIKKRNKIEKKPKEPQVKAEPEPEPIPIDLAGDFKVGNVTFSSAEGAFARVPNQTEINKNNLGFGVKMNLEDFDRLVPSRTGRDDATPFIDEAFASDRKIGTPFLQVDWDADAGVWRVTGHEGRGRLQKLKQEQGNAEVPVQIFPGNVKMDEVTEDMAKAPIVGQKQSADEILGTGGIEPSAVVRDGQLIKGDDFFGATKAKKQPSKGTMAETDEILFTNPKERLEGIVENSVKRETIEKAKTNVRNFIKYVKEVAEQEGTPLGNKGAFGEGSSRNTYGYTEKNQKFLASLRDTGRKALSMIAKAARSLGVDDLRSLDLVRTTKSGKLKRILGKNNQTEIKFWNPEKVGDGIPRGVLVKKQTSDGLVLHFLTNKKTTMEPSKWVKTEEGLRLNPDWDMVHLNHTLDKDGNFQFYVRELVDGRPMYRKAKDGEAGDVLLNIQNPIRMEDELQRFKDAGAELPESMGRDAQLSDDSIVGKEIDGYIRKVKGEDYYEPVREKDQALYPEDVLKEQERKAVFSEKSGVKNQREAILENVAKAGFGEGVVGRTVKWAIAGEIADAIFTEEDSYGGEIGAGIGLLLGIKPLRNAIKTVSYTSARSSADMFDNLYNWARNMEPDQKEKEMLNVWDPAGDTRDKEYIEWFDSLISGIKSAALAGKDVSEALTKNRFVQSTFSMLEEIAHVPGVSRLKKLLLNVEHTPNELKAKLNNGFNTRFRQMVRELPDNHPRKEEFIQMAEGDPFKHRTDEMVRFVDDFIEENNLDALKVGTQTLRVSKMSEQDKVRYFNEQFWRIMNSGARFTDDGRYIRGATRNTEHIYKNAERPQLLEAMDKRFLQDEYFGTFTNSMRGWFGDVKEEWLTMLSKNINDNLSTIDSQYIDLARKLARTQDSLGDFKKALNKKERKLFDQAMGKSKNNDKEFKRLASLKRVRDRFDDLGETYLPQVWSNRKFSEAQESYIADHMRLNEGATRKQAKNAFINKVMTDWMNLNNKKPRILQRYSVDDEQVKTHKFTSRKEAKANLKEIIKSQFSLEERTELLKDDVLDSFIKETKEKVVSPSTQEMHERTRFVIEEPENFKQQYGISIVSQPNRQTFEQFYDLMTTGGLIKSSNYLENPRNFVLPNYLAEDNFDTLFYKYTEDVGRKLHFAREGVFVEDDMSREFLNKIGRALGDEFADQENPLRTKQKYLNRIKDVYRQQTGLVHEIRMHKTAEDRAAFMRKKIRNSQLVGTIRNGIGMGYVWGIGWYDVFQHAIMSPLLTSWGSWGKAMKVMKGTDAANRMTDVGTSLQYSTQKIHTFLPEIDELAYADKDVLFGKAYQYSKSGLDWAGDFSFTKEIGKRTGWFNTEDWGTYRLFAEGFYGVNQTATAINGLAHLAEAEELAKVWKEIQANNGNPIRKGLKTYTEGDVKRGLETVGIFEDEIDDFVAKNDQINNFIDYIANAEQRSMNMEDLSADQHAYIRRILETATDSYHGRNRMFRPETWNTSMGRLLGQYSFYPMNFGLQTLQRRIRQPIQGWNKQYGHLVDGEKLPAAKLFVNLQQGEEGIKKLKSMMNGTDEEIDAALRDFPIDAYSTVMKLLPATGLTFAMTLTTDAVDDLTWYFANELSGMITGEKDDETEYMERSKENFILNPYAPESEQRTLEEVFNDPEFKDVGKFLGWMLSYTADMGTFGKYGNSIMRDSRFEQNGILDLSPVGREAENLFNATTGAFGTIWQEGGEGFGGHVGKGLYDFITPKIPVIGSQGLLRKKTKEAIFSEPKRGTRGEVIFNSEDNFGNPQTFGSDGVLFE